MPQPSQPNVKLPALNDGNLLIAYKPNATEQDKDVMNKIVEHTVENG